MRKAFTPGCAASASCFRPMTTPASSETPGLHGVADEKSSASSSRPTSGLRSGVGPAVAKTRAVGVWEAGNHTMVGVVVGWVTIGVAVFRKGTLVATAAHAGVPRIRNAYNTGRRMCFMWDFAACCTIKSGFLIEYPRHEAKSRALRGSRAAADLSFEFAHKERMMAEKTVLVTGACGEIGQALVQELSKRGGYRIVTEDMAPLPAAIKDLVAEHVQGDLVYKVKIFYDYDVDIIFHLAACLSSKAEIATEEAHRINVEGTMQLLMLAAYRSEKYNKAVKFLFPSSIAAYGMTLAEKRAAGCVT